jgi:hypothetical protein
MQGLNTLLLVSRDLESISLPTLTQPDLTVLTTEDARTEARISWSVRFYVYSVIAHLRAVLRGLTAVANSGNLPATFILARHVFEWAAQVCYVNENLAKHVASKDWKAAKKLLERVVTGSEWFTKHGHKYNPAQTAVPVVPKNLPLREVWPSYDAYLKRVYGTERKDDYGLLSEFSHPNAACLQQYHDNDTKGGDVRFVEPITGSPLPHANWCLVDLITFLVDLLRLCGEQTVRLRLEGLASELAQITAGKRRE